MSEASEAIGIRNTAYVVLGACSGEAWARFGRGAGMVVDGNIERPCLEHCYEKSIK